MTTTAGTPTQKPKPTPSEILKELLKTLIPAIIPLILRNVGGFQGWVLGVVLKYGGRDLYNLASKAIDDYDRKIAQEKAKAVLDKVTADPKSTAEDIGKAAEDYFNAGRK